MDWLLAPTSTFLVLILCAPLLVLLGAAVLLVVGQFLPGGATLSRVRFDCPFSRRRATVEFLSPSGGERPTDILSCSVFDKPYQVRCQKSCLAMAETGWTPSPVMPRFALLADGVTYRRSAPLAGQAPDSPTGGAMTRAA